MEWFIKKNSTQPILQLEFSLNGRSDFNKNENLTNFPSVYISFLDVNKGKYLSTSKTCYITKSGSTTNPNVEKYYVNYQFTNKETKNIGRYEAQLSMIGTDGTNILPTSEKLYINVIDSFSADYYGFDTNYKLERPCCNGKGITPEPEPEPLPDALLFIEPVSKSSFISNYMTSKEANFYGFNYGIPPTSDDDVLNYMEMYANYGNDVNLPIVIRQTIPQTDGGYDDFNNPITKYNFLTTEIDLGTINEDAWYTWIIPMDSLGGGKQTKISYSTSSPNDLLTENMNNVIYQYDVVYNGASFNSGKYSVYTTFQSHNFRLNNNNRYIYFKGHTVE